MTDRVELAPKAVADFDELPPCAAGDAVRARRGARAGTGPLVIRDARAQNSSSMDTKLAEESLRCWLAGESPQPCPCGGSLLVEMISKTGRPRGLVRCNRCRDSLEVTAPWHAHTSTVWKPAMGIPVRCPDDSVLVTFEEAADTTMSRRMIYTCPWCGGSTRSPLTR